jgi:hypothetical protein
MYLKKANKQHHESGAEMNSRREKGGKADQKQHEGELLRKK